MVTFQSARAFAPTEMLEEFTKEPAKAKGLKGWINRLLGRGLSKIDNR